MRIGIVVDSACDLPREFLDQHGVLVMPITLRIGNAAGMTLSFKGQVVDLVPHTRNNVARLELK